MPTPLVFSATVGAEVSSQMVHNRELQILTITDKNKKMAAAKATLLANLHNEFFHALVKAIRPTAPLLVKQMERDLKQAHPFDKYHDGKRFWDHLETMIAPARMLPNEDLDHDDALRKLEKNPLPNGASAQQFAARIDQAMNKHIPFLSRKFDSDKDISLWVLGRVPQGNAAEARMLFKSLCRAACGAT